MAIRCLSHELLDAVTVNAHPRTRVPCKRRFSGEVDGCARPCHGELGGDRMFGVDKELPSGLLRNPGDLGAGRTCTNCQRSQNEPCRDCRAFAHRVPWGRRIKRAIVFTLTPSGSMRLRYYRFSQEVMFWTKNCLPPDTLLTLPPIITRARGGRGYSIGPFLVHLCLFRQPPPNRVFSPPHPPPTLPRPASACRPGP